MQPVGGSLNLTRINELQESKQNLEKEMAEKCYKYMHSVGSQYFAHGFTSLKQAEPAFMRTTEVIRQKDVPPTSLIRKINIALNILKVALYLPIIGQIIGSSRE